MSQPQANCPSCGAPIVFRWSGAVQTTCEFCHSILVRVDLDLTKVATVADLPPDSSPIQLGTEGQFQNRAFVVVGRIIYEYDQGAWNEWHLIYNDGKSGWLSDAQLEYDLSFQSPPLSQLPMREQLSLTTQFQWEGRKYQVTSITRAHYRGVEGELPFQYWDKYDMTFADLRTTTGEFATIDYSENPPLLFLGRPVEFDDLKFKNLREFEGWKF